MPVFKLFEGVLGFVEGAADGDHERLHEFEGDVLLHAKVEIEAALEVDEGGLIGEEKLGPFPFTKGVFKTRQDNFSIGEIELALAHCRSKKIESQIFENRERNIKKRGLFFDLLAEVKRAVSANRVKVADLTCNVGQDEIADEKWFGLFEKLTLFTKGTWSDFFAFDEGNDKSPRITGGSSLSCTLFD